MPTGSLEAHRRALLRAQGADPDEAAATIASTLRGYAIANATAWSIVASLLALPLALLLAHDGQWTAVLPIGAIVAVHLFVRYLGRLEATTDAVLTEKFVTERKRRAYVVFGRDIRRVGRGLHDLLEIGVRYRIHTNAAGALVLDVAPH